MYFKYHFLEIAVLICNFIEVFLTYCYVKINARLKYFSRHDIIFYYSKQSMQRLRMRKICHILYEQCVFVGWVFVSMFDTRKWFVYMNCERLDTNDSLDVWLVKDSFYHTFTFNEYVFVTSKFPWSKLLTLGYVLLSIMRKNIK